MNKALSSCLLGVGLLSSALSHGQDFAEITLDSPYTPIQPLFAADVIAGDNLEIVLLGVDDKSERHLVLYGVNAQGDGLVTLDDITIPRHFHSFDMERDPEKKRPGIFFMSANELATYQPGENGGALKSIAKISSVYQQEATSLLARARFVTDINQDGLLDLQVADFNRLHLYLSTPDGDWVAEELPIPAQMVAENGRVTYSAPAVFVEDANGDKLMDVVHAQDGQLVVYPQTGKGEFGDPITVKINPDINGIDWWNKRDANGEEFDQSQLVYRKLDQLKDINNDGWPDMVVRFTQSKGVLDRTNDYEVYLGKGLIDRVSYGNKADSVIRADGTLTGLDFVDIDHDGRFEVTLAGFDIGVGQIIGALLSGSIDQDVYLYQLNGDDKFGEEPATAHTVDLKFSLTKGQSGSAIVKLADINGDGYKDLLLSKDTKALRIYAGQQGSSPFASKAIRYKTLLPENGEPVQTADINRDGKADLLLRFGRLDASEQLRTIKILLAR
ncbi:FG-GAP repeat domain-containing protein [Simiduia agarivorans]|uniref:FG-GAP repeat-containing protein n=1 Tax=Simiduia agarivorans (strain DSM 21679 / JCM 13881 / BCRC 17597 / SA1) TaxID=1117647 RepID=K4KKH2_SIMAS|nr:VCBS repeat-containing protein [Simiduia agarivorans]AFU98543.1 hypothetical protein M5M_06740 [Simiduia agarivorans SA1 = DSM 21679]